MPARARRYAAFLRGVMPTNARMPALRACFEAAGCTDVATVLGSGNVVFRAAGTPAALARAAEAAMSARLGRTFATIVRPLDELAALLATDPYADAGLPPEAKRVVSFLRARPRPAPRLPIERDGARIVRIDGDLAFSAYVPSPRGPVFMALIEATFGADVTTRTWATLAKVVAAGAR